MWIVNRLNEAQQTTFNGLVIAYNILIYPVCIWAVVKFIVLPALRHRQALNDRSADTRIDFDAARQQALSWPRWAALLACIGIVSHQVNGFFLRENNKKVEPVPHRWLEIELPGQRRIFYDPQYQDFSSRYLVTNLGIALDSIERFQGVIIRKNKKILDE
ncbi:MAG: hypothetical protein IH584_06355 [Candidatus Aminicenantes bacterium]|nr:hypothetical protein [Candidatus Aminicenantes bacterium]